MNAGDTTQSVPRGFRSSPAGKEGDDVQASTALDKVQAGAVPTGCVGDQGVSQSGVSTRQGRGCSG